MGLSEKMSDLDWMLGVLREDSEVWEQVVWGSCGCPIPECAQGQIGWVQWSCPCPMVWLGAR